MNGLDPRVLVPLWEAAADLPPQERAIRLLGAARGDGAPRETLAALSIGTRDRALLEAWRGWFGDALTALDACPACAEPVELSLSVSALLSEVPEPGPCEFDLEDLRVRLRPLDTDDLLAAGSAPDAEAAARVLRGRAVLGAWRGERAVGVDELPPEAVDALSEALDRADPLAEILLPVTCPGCGQGWSTLLEPAAHLWSRVSDEARQALWEVHLLASAYGWTEQEVLALSPRRRRWYVERVSA